MQHLKADDIKENEVKKENKENEMRRVSKSDIEEEPVGVIEVKEEKDKGNEEEKPDLKVEVQVDGDENLEDVNLSPKESPDTQ